MRGIVMSAFAFSPKAIASLTGAASLAIALAEARAEHGQAQVALSALGGGMRWGSALWHAWA